MHSAELQVERTGRARRHVREHTTSPPFTRTLAARGVACISASLILFTDLRSDF